MKKLCLLGMLAAPIHSVTAAVLINGGFEQPDIPDATATPTIQEGTVPGWETTDSQGRIEIWDGPVQGFDAFEGGQFAELNAFENAALYQDVNISEVGAVDFGFAHRGRASSTISDVMRLDVIYAGANGVIDTPEGSLHALGTNAVVLGGDDVLMVDGSAAANQFGATNVAWIHSTRDNAFSTTSGTIGLYRFSYGAVSSAGGNTGIGNFIDGVVFGVNTVPEPSTVMISVIGGLALLRRRRR